MTDIRHIFTPFLTGVLLMLASCSSNGGKSGDGSVLTGDVTVDSATVIAPRHAKGFTVDYKPDGLVLVDIADPEKAETQVFRFAVKSKGADVKIPEGYTPVEVPVQRVVCMTSLQLSNFIKLGIPDRVVGITSTRHLRNAKMKSQLKDGTTHKIGIEGNFDSEVVMAIDPDVIFISPFKRGGYDAIRGVDVPMIPHLGYKELTPLGQAEWIKLVGLLTGHTAEANEIFDGIESRYNDLVSLASGVDTHPMVMSGEMRSGNWYAVGGDSFLAHLFRDAGADYFLKDNSESGGVTLDYETVYSNAAHADYWRIVNSFDGDFGYDTLEAQDKRYTDFDAWKNHGVIYCNMKEVPFYESMPVEPEVILADFIHVFHPTLLPDHQPVYYRLLK